MALTKLEKLEFAYFLSFLKKNKILGKYMHNYYNQDIVTPLGKGQQIMNGFVWSKTEQGAAFWCNMENQWNDEYQKFFYNYTINSH